MYLAGNVAFRRALGVVPITWQAVAMRAVLASSALGFSLGPDVVYSWTQRRTAAPGGDSDTQAVEGASVVAALSWGESWLFALVVLLPFVWVPCVVLVLLNKIFASPERAINVRIRLFPWPRIEIDAKASADSVETTGSDILASGP
jgi:hypothetical protein